MSSSSESSESANSPLLLGHIVPVLLGAVVTLFMTWVTDLTLAANGLLASDISPTLASGTLLLLLAYRALFATLGCHVAARVAPPGNPRIRYALALGTLLLLLNVVGAVTQSGQLPLWYSLCAIALTFPCAILGGGTAVRALARARRPD